MRGDLGLMVKQQSVTGFNVKLTPMGTRLVSLPDICTSLNREMLY